MLKEGIKGVGKLSPPELIIIVNMKFKAKTMTATRKSLFIKEPATPNQ